jgi:Tol biopolymer transport system component
MISQTEQIPGMLAWSPDGQWVAYAAVDAGQVNPDTAYQATWDNPAVAGRRIYLMTPGNGRHVRVNDGETFQDAPLWSEDGATLYYVERQGQELVLMAFDVKTGQAQPVPGARQALPEAAGYYGQLDVDALLARRPAPTATPTPGRCG